MLPNLPMVWWNVKRMELHYSWRTIISIVPDAAENWFGYDLNWNEPDKRCSRKNWMSVHEICRRWAGMLYPFGVETCMDERHGVLLLSMLVYMIDFNATDWIQIKTKPGCILVLLGWYVQTFSLKINRALILWYFLLWSVGAIIKGRAEAYRPSRDRGNIPIDALSARCDHARMQWYIVTVHPCGRQDMKIEPES